MIERWRTIVKPTREPLTPNAAGVQIPLTAEPTLTCRRGFTDKSIDRQIDAIDCETDQDSTYTKGTRATRSETPQPFLGRSRGGCEIQQP